MDKSATKGLESKGSDYSDAAIRSSRILKEYPQPAAKRLKSEGKIFNEFIMGPKGYPVVRLRDMTIHGPYDTCLPKDVVKKALIEHFSSCGEVVHLIGPLTGVLKKGPGAVEKAVELNNGGCKCHVEGCKIVVDNIMIHGPDTEPFTWPCRWVPSQEGQD